MSTRDTIAKLCETDYSCFFEKPNVVGMATGIKVSNGLETGEDCLTIFVSKKINKINLDTDDLIPKMYKNFKTDVVEIGVIKALSLTSTIRPMPFGYSISPANLYLAGTAGCLTSDDFNYYILSNNHVIASENQLALGSPIIQAATIDGGTYPNDVIAHLSNFVPINFETATSTPVNYVDAAIAKIDDPSSVLSEIALIGEISGINFKPKRRLRVKKSGRTTGFTEGRIRYLNATVQVLYSGGKVALFKNQIITTAMSSPGDSGSLLVDNRNFAVGLLFAGSDSATVHNPIREVLQALNISIV